MKQEIYNLLKLNDEQIKEIENSEAFNNLFMKHYLDALIYGTTVIRKEDILNALQTKENA